MTHGFFKITDAHSSQIEGYSLPEKWWSRRYEYPWACQQISENEVVVDAGCGDIHPLKYILADRVKAIYAIDNDMAAIREARKDHDKPSINYLIGDLRKIALKNESIDSVFCISVLEHLDRKAFAASLQEFLRILKPEGRLILTVDLPFKERKRFSYTAGWLKDVTAFLRAIPAAFEVKGAVEIEPGPDAVWHERFNLCVFHIIFTKRAY
jgi:SAM-dependent methyltransferase